MNNKKKTKAQRSNYQKYFPMIIFISILFMGVGYAVINSINLNIDGEAIAKEQSGVYITETTYHSNVSANTSSSKIINAYQSMLQSDITLSSTNASSSITYQVTVYNSTSFDYLYNGVNYELGTDTYSNEGISVTVNDLSVNDTVASKSYKTFTITFSYKDGTLASSNNLKSYITFDFILKPIIVGDYSYTGEAKTFTAPYTGTYKIELWGASGGDNLRYKFTSLDSDLVTREREVKPLGGYGGYTSGEIYLNQNAELYVYVGEQGKKNRQPTFNGGGAGALGGTGYNGQNSAGGTNTDGFSGGGATDIRIKYGEWSDFESLKSRIMVAAGGGGATVEAYSNAGGLSYAGGLNGYSGGYFSGHTNVGQNGQGGTQTSGGVAGKIHFNATGTITAGAFGIGGYTTSISSQTGAGGGGGGYYGGSGASGTLSGGVGQGGGGGSSYISGHNGCNSISSSSTESNIVHTNSSTHYSNYAFTNTLMIDGAGYKWTTDKTTSVGMPTHDGTSTMTGNIGNGYAKITFIKE